MAAVDHGPGDAALWSLAAHGDHDAFGQLFDRHAGAVYSYLFRLTANWSEAEDLTSAVFLQAWRRRAEVVIDRDSSLPWLLGTGGRSITAHLVYRGAAAVITHRVTGGVLDLGYRCPARSRDCGVSFDVTVPRDLGVTVRWDVGQIRLDGLAGPITARTGVGRIQASGLSGPRIRLSTGTGTVSAGFTAPPREAVVTSGVGSVTIHVPAGAEYQVDASTQVGSVRVAVPRAAGSGHVIEATTGAGSVTVTH